MKISDAIKGLFDACEEHLLYPNDYDDPEDILCKHAVKEQEAMKVLRKHRRELRKDGK